MTLYEIVPDPDALLRLEPDEVGAVLLEHLHHPGIAKRGEFHASGVLPPIAERYPPAQRERIGAVLSEGWMWLQQEGLLVPKPGDNNNWMILSRRGGRFATRADVSAYVHSQLLPRKQLHPNIATKVYSTFLRGDYDTAVFQAFKEVEVAVREASGLEGELGVSLMRKAFHTETGRLRNPGLHPAERQGMLDLFAGAIALYKNPHSHRNVPLTDPTEAVEMVVLASHLLRIVNGGGRACADSADSDLEP